jgi:MoxR-like ATPase
MTTTSNIDSPFMRALAAGIQAGVPTLIWGGPGEIKTAFIENASATWGRTCKTIVGSTREAPDFLGVMVQDDEGDIAYSSFKWVRELNQAKAGLLFLDEWNTASPSTMKGMLRMVQERYVGETKLKDSVAIVAAANPTDIAVDAYDIPGPMANRMMHLDWVFPEDFWLENVVTDFQGVVYPRLSTLLTGDPATRRANVAGAVTAYLKHTPGQLKPGQPKDQVKAGKAWASPRAWTNVISVLSQLHADDTEAALLVVKGLVGDAAAVKFINWLRAADLFNPSEVIADPYIVPWATVRADRLFALVQALGVMGSNDPEAWEGAALALTKCAEAGKPDFATPSAQKLMNNIPAKKRMPRAFREAFQELFENTHHSISAAA